MASNNVHRLQLPWGCLAGGVCVGAQLVFAADHTHTSMFPKYNGRFGGVVATDCAEVQEIGDEVGVVLYGS